MNTVKCRKCNGSGEFAYGGICYNCSGTGEVQDVRYQTTPASESKHPAIITDREDKPLPFTPPDEAHVKRKLAECWSMLAEDGGIDAPEEPTGPLPALCEHDFVRGSYTGDWCRLCGITSRQHLDSMTWEPAHFETR